ncbi:thaumatin-like protein 1b [Corylus avellana]|uniref:thaumatin-like protein 1b n=1 Tax=Corylus avellana TaxID=13451 RepID=UPI00286C8F7B|nr:thaumatin-like protein 1b [Corylus avellana]
MVLILKLGLLCSHAIPATGPSMKQVMQFLDGDADLQELPHDNASFGASTSCAKNSTGAFSCLTGDCGSSTVECPDGNPASPATAAAFDLKDHEDNVDFLVQAFPGLSYNLPMTVVPLGGIGGSCNESGCSMDFSSACPTATDVSASCKNATCEMRDYKKYCCMAGPKIVAPCTPSLYMDFLHQKCPTADSIGYDEGTGTYTCSYLHDIVSYCQKPCTTTPTDYVITFCLPAAIE